MVGIASRYFAGRVTLATAAAVVLGVATGMDGTGHLVMFGTIVLGTAAAAFALLASLALSVGDGDSADRERAHAHPALPAYWPIMAALGMGVLMVGLVTDGILTILGISLLIIAALEWTVSAWSERLSTDAAANATERDRLAAPLEIPLYGALGIAIPVVLISRILLASSRNGASWIAIAMSSAILAFAFVIYTMPQLRKSIVATVLVLAGVGVIVAGITAAAIGERDFHHHEEEHDDGGDEADEQSAPALNAPVVVR
ncbi:MAG: hypothetical protein P8N02_17000 [Actinomycetota bacterium]|jgi:hypothetical protein|nr:hypothetical protein [Actinomycetota bacterium]